MSDIRYICLSDLHLGAENSILTSLTPASSEGGTSQADPSKPNAVMLRFADCLRLLVSQNKDGRKPTLVLNGDILELALADVNRAAMVFERFMELTMKPGEELFDPVIYYNPGNHDHHLWEAARETQYNAGYLALRPWGAPLDPPWHTTNMFLEEYDPVPCQLLNVLLSRMKPGYADGRQPQFLAVYPNFGVRSADRKKCVIFSHGHYIESIYRLMTTFRSILFPDRTEPELVWDLESENFAWVDFFWSTMGRSGDFGQDVELIYDKLQSDVQLKKLLGNLADAIAKQLPVPWVPQSVEHLALTALLNVLVGKITNREVKQTDTVLSADAEAGLKLFLEKYLLRQIGTDNNGRVPDEVTFIFGHTHKPFEQIRPYAGYANGVKVYNDGGWVADSLVPAPLQGGAVILVDEDLNTASVRLYNEAASETQEPPAPHVSEVIDNPLVQQLKTVLAGAAPCAALTRAVFSEIPLQRANLNAKINAAD